MGTNQANRTSTTSERDGAPTPLIDLLRSAPSPADRARARAPHGRASIRPESRERLVEAAGEVFLERGYAGATVSAIARNAGFTTGALYGYFESKEELIGEAVAEAINGLVRRLLETALAEPDPADAAHALLVAVLSDPKDAGDAFVMHGLAAAHGEDSAAVVRPELMQMVEVVRQLLRAGQAEGVIDADVDFDAFLYLTAALMFGSVALKVLGVEAPSLPGLDQVLRRFEAAFAPEDDTPR